MAETSVYIDEIRDRTKGRTRGRIAGKLQGATKENYTHHSSRKARYRPNYKDKPAAGKPVIRKATPWHKARLTECSAAAV